MCEANEEALPVYTKRNSQAVLEIKEIDGALIPFNKRDGSVQFEGYRGLKGNRTKVRWKYGRWHECC